MSSEILPSPSAAPRMDRRTAIAWMLTAAAAAPLLRTRVLAAGPSLSSAPGSDPAPAATTGAKGYGTDPDMLKAYKPGDLWPLTLTEAQRAIAGRLCDLIIPADAVSPSAQEVGVVDFIDEWISAPYPQQQHDRTTVLDGLKWLDEESNRRFGRVFTDLKASERTAIADDICYVETVPLALRKAAQFFARFRDLTAGGFYTSPQGRKDIGYIGNVPLPSFDGPPPEVLRKVGLAPS